MDEGETRRGWQGTGGERRDSIPSMSFTTSTLDRLHAARGRTTVYVHTCHHCTANPPLPVQTLLLQIWSTQLTATSRA